MLPLNSCCNPFLYAILTKQFKKDCVMICKTIEESRVTRGIGRCRHSSNFSNRQTPANTNSLNSGSAGAAGGGGSHSHSRGTVCSCNSSKSRLASSVGSGQSRLFVSQWPFNRIKHIFQPSSRRDGGSGGGHHRHGGGGGDDKRANNSSLGTGNDSFNAQEIAKIQYKQAKVKRNGSVSSDAFSSSR